MGCRQVARLLEKRFVKKMMNAHGIPGCARNRLQAVPFWIVVRSREIAEREKTGANESLLGYFSSLQSRCAVSSPSRLTRKGLSCSLRAHNCSAQQQNSFRLLDEPFKIERRS